MEEFRLVSQFFQEKRFYTKEIGTNNMNGGERKVDGLRVFFLQTVLALFCLMVLVMR